MNEEHQRNGGEEGGPAKKEHTWGGKRAMKPTEAAFLGQRAELVFLRDILELRGFTKVALKEAASEDFTGLKYKNSLPNLADLGWG